MRAYALDHLAQDIAALIDASGATEVTLIAHDWGAIIAWAFAIGKVRPLTRLVILNVPRLMIWGEEDIALNIRGTEGTENGSRSSSCTACPAYRTGCSRKRRNE